VSNVTLKNFAALYEDFVNFEIATAWRASRELQFPDEPGRTGRACRTFHSP